VGGEGWSSVEEGGGREDEGPRGRRRLERVREQLGLTGHATHVRQHPGPAPFRRSPHA
jgi:hypothetical protein